LSSAAHLMISRNLLEKAAAIVLCCLLGSAVHAGVLRVHPDNPRYFTDGSGKAIYLGGHQIFVDLQDNSFNKEFVRNRRRTLDWSEYLDFLKQYNLNYLRNWVIWSTGSGSMAPLNNAIASPMPYKRGEGQGKANDGGDKFDLRRLDDEFFRRMRQRCGDLQDRGVYVSIMLFEVYGFLGGEACGSPKQTLWDGNVFNKANNVNGIHVDYDGDGLGIEFFYTDDPHILKLQQDYVRKVIDAVNDLDNVMYEIANELYAPQWQYRMVQFIENYEGTKPKQHLVMISGGGRTISGSWKLMEKKEIIDSPADCLAVSGGWDSGRYTQKNPPANDSGKPAIVDMDHVSPGSADLGYVWTAFTRGYHFNLYDAPFESPDAEGPQWQAARHNVGKAVYYARRCGLVNMNPRGDLASTGFCLANPGVEYIVYAPGGSPFSVSGLQAGGSYYYEWYDPEENKVIASAQTKPENTVETFTPPNQSIVLYLRRI